jgi:hypothetical protein
MLKALLVDVFDGTRAVAGNYEWKSLLEADAALYVDLRGIRLLIGVNEVGMGQWEL